MKHPRRLIIAAALVLLVGTGLFLCLRPRREPTWQGKTYSQWFAEFRQAKVRHRQNSQAWIMSPGSPKPIPTTGYYDDFDGLLRDPAADALRAMDTNIVPFLTAEVRREDSIWVQSYQYCYSKFPRPIKRIAPGFPQGRNDIRIDASLALAALGTNAASAVPAIFRAYATARPWSRHAFDESLRRLPLDIAAYDAALETLVKRGELFDAVSLVGQFGIRTTNSLRAMTNAVLCSQPQASEAATSQLSSCRRYAAYVLPALREALKNGSSRETCQFAASTLESYGEEAAEAVPELVEALKSRDGELRYRAARALESIGTNAFPAVPALLNARNDTNEMVQKVVTRTLNKLSGTNY